MGCFDQRVCYHYHMTEREEREGEVEIRRQRGRGDRRQGQAGKGRWVPGPDSELIAKAKLVQSCQGGTGGGERRESDERHLGRGRKGVEDGKQREGREVHGLRQEGWLVGG